MDGKPKDSRRRFIKLCASAVAMVSASPTLLARNEGALRRYPRARLVDTSNRPVTPAALKVGEGYLFHYPYVSTPCFLLNLGRPTVNRKILQTEVGKRYRWQGGVGPQHSVVAFSAICAHKMTHPARAVSFINYRHKPVSFKDKAERLVRRSRIIYCCSENSVYDPAQGAQVLGGPAPQPLAAIRLEYDDRDGTLYATGAYGGEMFEKFFEEFSFRLTLEFLTPNIRDEVIDTARVMSLAEYCRTQVLC